MLICRTPFHGAPICLAVALALLVAMIPAASCDTLIKLVQHTPTIEFGAMVIPERNDTILIWLGDNKARMDAANDVSTLYDAETDSTVVVYHKFEIYTHGLLSPFGGGEPAGGVDLTAGLAALNPTFITHVEKTSESQLINGWNCVRWVQCDSMPMMGAVLLTDTWTTEDTKVDFAVYSKLLAAGANRPAMKAGSEEQPKITGLPILTVVEIRADSTAALPTGLGSRDEIVLIQEVQTPPGHYDIPAGYELFSSNR